MKKAPGRMSLIAGLFAAAIAVIAGGCGGGGDSAAEPLDVTGVWSLAATGHPAMTLNLTHTGSTITGTVTDSLGYSQTITGTTAAAAGALEPRDVTLVVTFSDGQIATYIGTVSDGNTSMSGSYTTNWGTGDSWTATRL